MASLFRMVFLPPLRNWTLLFAAFLLIGIGCAVKDDAKKFMADNSILSSSTTAMPSLPRGEQVYSSAVPDSMNEQEVPILGTDEREPGKVSEWQLRIVRDPSGLSYELPIPPHWFWDTTPINRPAAFASFAYPFRYALEDIPDNGMRMDFWNSSLSAQVENITVWKQFYFAGSCDYEENFSDGGYTWFLCHDRSSADAGPEYQIGAYLKTPRGNILHPLFRVYRPRDNGVIADGIALFKTILARFKEL